MHLSSNCSSFGQKILMEDSKWPTSTAMSWRLFQRLDYGGGQSRVHRCGILNFQDPLFLRSNSSCSMLNVAPFFLCVLLWQTCPTKFFCESVNLIFFFFFNQFSDPLLWNPPQKVRFKFKMTNFLFDIVHCSFRLFFFCYGCMDTKFFAEGWTLWLVFLFVFINFQTLFHGIRTADFLFPFEHENFFVCPVVIDMCTHQICDLFGVCV